MDFQLTVSTDVLREKAGEISDGVKQLRTDWDEIKRIVENSKSYWKGESGTEHRKRLASMEDDTDTALRRLEEHHGDLLQMAGIYETTENEITEVNSGLPSDVIV